MTFGELKSELRPQLWPGGEAPKLRIPHDKLFIEAMVDLQKYVPCLQNNNTQIFNFCSTMFQCGMTVINAPPHGMINKVSVFARLDENGREDRTADVDWCSEVEYHRIPHHKLLAMLSRRLGCSCSSLASLSVEGCKKILTDRFPAPDDADYVGFPELPLGFHYPQSSTDSVKGRAQIGAWSLERGAIYISPWIQSTEVVLVEWDGIKRVWSDNDLVDDDPFLKKAVKLYVAAAAARDFEDNMGRSDKYAEDFREARADLMHNCHKESSHQAKKDSRARGSHQVLTNVIPSCTTTTTSTTTTTTSTTTGTTTCALPTLPTEVTAELLEFGLIQLNWVPGTGDLQEIWRSINGGAYELFLTVSGVTNSYDDTDLAVGMEHCYQIRGKSNCGNGEFTEPVCAENA